MTWASIRPTHRRYGTIRCSRAQIASVPSVVVLTLAASSIAQAQPRDLPIAQWQHSTTLNRSEATIKVRVLHILQKLNAADRTEAMTLGLQRGIIHLP